MEAISSCKVVGSACTHRPQSGLSASSSCAQQRSCASFVHKFPRGGSDSNITNSTVLEMIVGRIAQRLSISKPWNGLSSEPNAQGQRLATSWSVNYRLWRQQALFLTRARVQDDFPLTTNNSQPGESEALQVGESWEKSRRFVVTRETGGGQEEVDQSFLTIRTRKACFAALSAQTYQPPVQVPERSQVSNYVAGGVLLSLGAWIVWVISKTEQYARKALVSPEETLVTPPPAPEMVEYYERAKASVSQAALVNEALAAVRTNDLIKCAVEMELALEENRLARTSIESDFFEEGELLQIYRGVLKVWLDGYPLDYGKILQLRGLLDIPSKEAEALEQEVQLQSDAYVI